MNPGGICIWNLWGNALTMVYPSSTSCGGDNDDRSTLLSSSSEWEGYGIPHWKLKGLCKMNLWRNICILFQFISLKNHVKDMIPMQTFSNCCMCEAKHTFHIYGYPTPGTERGQCFVFSLIAKVIPRSSNISRWNVDTWELWSVTKIPTASYVLYRAPIVGPSSIPIRYFPFFWWSAPKYPRFTSGRTRPEQTRP